MSTVQNVSSAVPIKALAPPPEGQMAVPFTVALNPLDYSFSTTFQLNAASAPISQVVSLLIDNTENPNSIIVSHGVFNQSITVPPLTLYVIPTFSAQGFYAISVDMAAAPLATVNVGLALLNYEKPASSFSEGTQTFLQGSSQIGSSLVNKSVEIAADMAWNGQLLFGGSGGVSTFFKIAGPFTGQGFVIKAFDIEIFGASQAAPAQINIGLGSGIIGSGQPNNFGYWPVLVGTATVSQLLASHDDLALYVPPGGSLFINAWNASFNVPTASGAALANVYGAILPVQAT